MNIRIQCYIKWVNNVDQGTADTHTLDPFTSATGLRNTHSDGPVVSNSQGSQRGPASSASSVVSGFPLVSSDLNANIGR